MEEEPFWVKENIAKHTPNIGNEVSGTQTIVNMDIAKRDNYELVHRITRRTSDKIFTRLGFGCEWRLSANEIAVKGDRFMCPGHQIDGVGIRKSAKWELSV